jgi:hypothetical protein
VLKPESLTLRSPLLPLLYRDKQLVVSLSSVLFAFRPTTSLHRISLTLFLLLSSPPPPLRSLTRQPKPPVVPTEGGILKYQDLQEKKYLNIHPRHFVLTWDLQLSKPAPSGRN